MTEEQNVVADDYEIVELAREDSSSQDCPFEEIESEMKEDIALKVEQTQKECISGALLKLVAGCHLQNNVSSMTFEQTFGKLEDGKENEFTFEIKHGFDILTDFHLDVVVTNSYTEENVIESVHCNQYGHTMHLIYEPPEIRELIEYDQGTPHKYAPIRTKYDENHDCITYRLRIQSSEGLIYYPSAYNVYVKFKSGVKVRKTILTGENIYLDRPIRKRLAIDGLRLIYPNEKYRYKIFNPEPALEDAHMVYKEWSASENAIRYNLNQLSKNGEDCWKGIYVHIPQDVVHSVERVQFKLNNNYLYDLPLRYFTHILPARCLAKDSTERKDNILYIPFQWFSIEIENHPDVKSSYPLPVHRIESVWLQLVGITTDSEGKAPRICVMIEE
jgi:hypothetical protein